VLGPRSWGTSSYRYLRCAKGGLSPLLPETLEADLMLRLAVSERVVHWPESRSNSEQM